MARWWYQNHSIDLGGQNFTTMLYQFKETAKNAGWTVLQASNGTTFWKVGDAGSEPITSSAWMAANNSWFLIQMPDGNRKFIFLHASVVQDWYIGYAKSGSYLDGGIAAPAVPDTAEELTIHGNQLTRAVKTIQNIYSAAQYYQIMCNDAAPYDFYAFLTIQGSGAANTVIYGEEVLDPSSGDLDPFVCAASNSGFGQYLHRCPDVPQTTYGNDKGCYGWLGDTMSSFGYMTWNEIGGPRYQFPPYTGGNGPGTNPWDGTDDIVRAVIGRINYYMAPSFKGVSNLFRYSGVFRASGTRFDIDSPGDWMSFENILLPWNNAVPSI